MLHCVEVTKSIGGLLNAHNCMGSCMLVKLLTPSRVIYHCRVHNWVQAQVVSFARKCFEAWLHYFYTYVYKKILALHVHNAKMLEHIIYDIYYTHYSLTTRDV